MGEPDTPARLKARALRYLVRREHSRAELARKLAPHAASAAAVEEVLDLLLSNQQQSDLRYAEERVRVLSRKYGPARIRHDLRAKGIAEEIVESLLALRERAGIPVEFVARSYFPTLEYPAQVALMQELAEEVAPHI